MTEKGEPEVYFIPLYFAPNSWIHEVSDKSLVPLVVKTVVRVTDVIQVELADVFSVTGYIPRLTKDKAIRVNLLKCIRDAVENRLGKMVEPLTMDVIIYGGKRI